MFPTSHVFWHVELNLLLEEVIHLLLYWIWLAADHESSSVIDTGHLVEVFVGIGEAAHHVELGVENILSVTSVLNTIVNNQLDHHFLGLIAVERQIFTIARNNISIFPESFFNTSFAV